MQIPRSQPSELLVQLKECTFSCRHDFVKRCKHIDFGMVKGMSTRKGNVVFLEEILDECREYNLNIMKKNEAKFKEMEV